MDFDLTQPEDSESRKFIQYVEKLQQDFARASAELHEARLRELAIAFICRYGLDPDQAEVVCEHQMTEEGSRTITYIRRRHRGSTSR